MIEIGRRDIIDLPDLELFEVEAKIDTGAYGCSIHCHDIALVEKDGRKVLTYQLLDPSHPQYQDQVLVAREFSDKIVKSSNGQEEHRYTVMTKLEVFGQLIEMEFSLADRQEMKYPILLGRKFLSGRFIVNVDRKNLSFKQKKTKK